MPATHLGFRKVSKATWRLSIGFAAVLLLAIIVALLIERRPRLTDEQLAERLVATIQREAPESFLVTGSVDITATVSVQNAKRFLPGILNVDLGTARAIVQVPGRAFYGFDVRVLDARRIRVRGDTIDIAVPPPAVLSIDTNLEDLRIWSEKGFLRSQTSRSSVEQSALKRIDGALHRQATQHLTSSAQPRINTAEAIRKTIDPVLRAAGIDDPVYRFDLDERLRME